MPKYRVTSPDGKSFEVTAPDGATQDEVLAYAQKNFASKPVDQAADMRRMADPVAGNSFLDNAKAGLGKVFADLGRGASQTYRMLGPQYAASADFLGLPNQADIAESRRMDAPLMATGGGKTGNILGNVALLAPTAAVGGSSIPAAAAIGAATGLLQPTETMAEKALTVGLGAAGGAAGQKIANVAGNYVANKAAANAATLGQRQQKAAAAKAAMDAGYVIPPADLSKSSAVQAVSGLSGKIKTAQEASARNQSVTNAIVKADLGIPDNAPIDLPTLAAIRNRAGQDYAAVASTGTIAPGKAYDDALDQIAAPFVKAAQGFPGAKPNPVIAEIEALRSPQFEAASAVAKIRELRSGADAAYAQGNKDMGRALKDGAQALEDAIDAHLVKIGAPADLLGNYRAARQTIAKTYTAQKALNQQTGDVSAQSLAGDLKRGKPLSGGMKTVAEAGISFPKATQALKETPKSLSPLDFGAAGLGLMGSGGNPLAAAGLVARPAARAALLSSPAQAMALRAAGKADAPNMLARLLQHDPASVPIGVLSGSALANYLAQQ